MTEASDSFEFEKLAHDMALIRIAKDAPSYQAAETASEIIQELVFLAVTHTKGKQDPHITLRGIFRGITQALFALNKDMPQACVRLLQEIPHLADRLELDFATLMTWAMEGIASLSGPLGRDNCHKIRAKIDENFMGAGEIFEGLCAKNPQAQTPK